LYSSLRQAADTKPKVMKNKILIISSFLSLFCFSLSSREIESKSNSTQKGSITVISSPDLLDLTGKWAKEYSSINPDVKISVVGIPEKGVVDLSANASLGFVSREYYSELNNSEVWKEVVGRDVIVPVFNSQNPFVKEINEQGISAADFNRILSNRSKLNWGTLFYKSNSLAIQYYFIDEEPVKSYLQNFMKLSTDDIRGTKVENENALIASIQKDPYAIGFCRLSDIVDSKTQQFVENISLMPIDRNENGKIDSNERIYGDLNSFSRGLWIGKYPRALYSNIYTVASAKPESETELAFVKWVLTDGQKFNSSNGYSDLAFNERQSKVEQLVASKIEPVAPENGNSNMRLALFILAAVVMSGFVLDGVIRYQRNKKAEDALFVKTSSVFNINSLKHPAGLYFGKSHTWAFMEEDGMVKIGIDDFLQHVTGAITNVKMKKYGDKVEKGELLVTIVQKGKQLNIFSPVSGTIKEQTSLLLSDASYVNSDPYSKGWIYMIEPANWMREIQTLFMADKYKTWLKNEFSRLKDFFAVFVNPVNVEYAHVVLQDGGELTDKLLSDLGPEVWEEFQTNFINKSK
jgi:glycine cleavage system H lipoate-binding protein/ABC-type phosphate transport system substrate-binding protein